MDSTGRLGRWNLRPSEKNFNVVYRAVIRNQAAHVLSHFPATEKEQTYLDDDLQILAMDDHEDAKRDVSVINAPSENTISCWLTEETMLDTTLIEKECVLKQIQ